MSIRRVLLPVMALLLLTGPVQAMDIQRVTSSGGIEAWLVEDYGVPLITMQAAWKRGAAADPSGKAGLANLGVNLLVEGAGDYDATAFQEQVEGFDIRLRFSAGQDNVLLRLETLVENRDIAFDLLRLAVTDPRFDEAAIERVRDQVVAAIDRDHQRPQRIAGEEWFRAFFGDHAYGRDVRGGQDSLADLDRSDLEKWHRNTLARDNLKVAVVGAIDAASLGALLDEVFGALPETAAAPPVMEVAARGEPKTIIVPRDNTQTVVTFGSSGLKRDDPDFMAAYIMNHILGGGNFSSRLSEELRQKRGLVYSASSYLYPFDQVGIFLGSMATENAGVAQSMDIVRGELTRMAEHGVSEDELNDAKTYLTGAYPLRFASNVAIAGQLIGIQTEDLGIDYAERRNGLVNAVTLEDIHRVARRLLDPDALTIVMVGAPETVTGGGE